MPNILLGGIMLLCTLGTLLPGVLHAQFPKRLTETEGFPSVTMFDLKQDPNGHIWAATHWGMGRFNGHEMEQFNPLPLVGNAAVVRLFQDSKDRIWGACHNNKAFYVENNSLHAYAFNDTLTKYISLSDGNVRLHMDYNTGLMHLFSRAGHHTIDSAGNFSSVPFPLPDFAGTVVHEIDSELYIYRVGRTATPSLALLTPDTCISFGEQRPGDEKQAGCEWKKIGDQSR